MISLLVRAGADVNARNERGETPLHRAVSADRPAIAARLLELGADADARSDSGVVADPVSCEHWDTPIFFAIANARQVADCIASGSDIHARAKRHRNVTAGSTPLHMAYAFTRDTAVVSVLLRAGADVHARDDENYQPLHVAARHRSPAMVRTLLQAGAEVDARAEGYRYHTGWDWTPLHLAATHNADPEVVGALLAAGADPHVRGYYGETPLHEAAANENPAVAALLLEAGADVHARGLAGRTPLHEAADRNGNPAVLAVLLDAGAELEARGTYPDAHWAHGNMTPLHEAARSNSDPAITTALIEAGADVHARVTGAEIPIALSQYLIGATPLHMASFSNGNPAVIEVLVRAGADPELRADAGHTALHLAARWSAAAFQTLLELGADPAALDYDGRTPMDYARENPGLQGVEEVMRLRGTPLRRSPPDPAP